ncbi:unnamed protein product, partial [Scytosiphon promiscuus]
RYKYDNIIAQDLDMPERTTQEYEGPGMVSFAGAGVDVCAGVSGDTEKEIE